MRIKATVGGVTTTYPSTSLRAAAGNYFEWTGSTGTMIKYFYANGQRVAMKRGSLVYFLFGDHLGSTSITANAATGDKLGELRYKAWGRTGTARE